MKKATLLVALSFATTLGIAATATANADEVTVQSGDTVSKIAQEHNTTVSSIQQLNHLQNVNLVFIGDKLQVSPNGSQQTTQQVPVQKAQSVSQPSTKPQTPVQSSVSSSNSAKEQVAQIESGGNYNAQNGKYQGMYQLNASYLHGDYSPANQERVADQYVASRYQGSWNNALQHEKEFGWY